MIDKDVIKALECCRDNNCHECPIKGCTDDIFGEVLDLIKRQKAEIERLQKENEILSKNADTAFQDGLNEAQDLYALQIKNEIKSEAVKEFAERLKEKAYPFPCAIGVENAVTIRTIDDLVKEMVGDSNAD